MQKNQLITWITLWITALGQAATSLYLPALPAITAHLQITPTEVKATITLFLLGYGFSQFFYGPLSDRYGRKPILLSGLVIFSIGCVMNMFAQSLSTFLLARLVQGLGCGSVIVIGRAVLRDCFSGRELASTASYLSMGFAVGLGATPVIGAYLQHYFGWQADFDFLLLMGSILFGVIWRYLPETFPDVESHLSIAQFLQQTIISYRTIATNIIFLRFLLGGLLAYGVVIAYNVMTPFLIQTELGYSAEAYGWLALLVAIPYYSAAVINRNLVLKFGSEPIIKVGIGLIILAGLLMAGTSFIFHLKLSTIIIPIMIATFGQAMIWPNAISGALQNFTQDSGKASAILSSLQMLLVGVLSAFMAILPDTTQLPLALVLIVLGLCSGLILHCRIKPLQ